MADNPGRASYTTVGGEAHAFELYEAPHGYPSEEGTAAAIEDPKEKDEPQVPQHPDSDSRLHYPLRLCRWFLVRAALSLARIRRTHRSALAGGMLATTWRESLVASVQPCAV